MKPYGFHPEAQLEADDAAAYYQGSDASASSNLFKELADIILEIRKTPKMWPFESGTSIQRRVFQRFPYILFYRNDLHVIYIVAVAHTSRRPGYWKSRIAG